VKSASVDHLRFSRAKAEKAIGWQPKVPIEEGIKRYVAWRRSNAG
jgi:UDP-glucose 4-epimerase